MNDRERWYQTEGGYGHIQATKPQTLAYGLNDSPAGLAAWIVEKFRAWSDCDGDVERRFSKDELYDIVKRIVEQWIAGFLTAHNLYVSDTYNVAGKSTMDDIEARLETACRANSKEHFAEAMISVIEQLNPQRVRAEGAK